MWWREPVTSLKGIGIKKALEFQKLNIETVGDLLNRFPRMDSYLDYSKVKRIGELTTDNEKQLFTGEVFRVADKYSGRGKRYTVITVQDDGSYADIFLFAAQRYQARKYKPGMRLIVIGKVRRGTTAKFVSEAFIQIADSNESINALGILPVYSLTGSLTQVAVRTAVKQALAKAEQYLPETLPASIITERQLPDRYTALKNIHFPGSFAKLAEAKKRFIFEELFLLQCGLLYYRDRIKEVRQGIKHGVDGKLVTAVKNSLPFELTEAQQKAWQEISLDMQDNTPMHRLLQGDVGSGKTVVSALALAKTAENGYQGCIMVPTEILAQQHFETLTEYLGKQGLRVELLTSSVKKAKRREILENLELGEIDVLVGTHALIQDDVVFARLALVVTDEQHRFGVDQRAKLSNKSQFAPDILVMTATPIPRTLAMTLYGDLDVSVIDELPPGRKPIATIHQFDNRRESLYRSVRKQIEEGRQVYIVYPLIKESEKIDLKNLEEGYLHICEEFPDCKVCKVHGKMKPAEKDAQMQLFISGDAQIMVATTVIEVGVNVPNASVMIIENAERFGLSQLHQLRGRVGRGADQSYCILVTTYKLTEETRKRLEIMVRTNDGFEIAEADLKLRGPGDLEGTQQSGIAFDLKIADIARDGQLLQYVRTIAEEITDADPGGVLPENAILWQQLRALRKTNVNWAAIS